MDGHNTWYPVWWKRHLVCLWFLTTDHCRPVRLIVETYLCPHIGVSEEGDGEGVFGKTKSTYQSLIEPCHGSRSSSFRLLVSNQVFAELLNNFNIFSPLNWTRASHDYLSLYSFRCRAMSRILIPFCCMSCHRIVTLNSNSTFYFIVKIKNSQISISITSNYLLHMNYYTGVKW